MDVTLRRPGAFCIGVIGDLHSHWDDWDLAHFDRSDYDVLLFTGDLGGGTPGSGMNIAKSISRLRRPTLVMPGNNDAADIARLSAEFGHQRGLSKILTSKPEDDARGEARLCGYSLHRLSYHCRSHHHRHLYRCLPHHIVHLRLHLVRPPMGL